MEKNSKIYIAGHNGMVGSSIVRLLKKQGYDNLLLIDKNDLDLTIQNEVEIFFKKEKPEYVFLAAAKVGGIQANMDSQAEFLYVNSMIQLNIIHQAYKFNVRKVLILGSSCIYPTNSKQPIKEEYLLTDKLEPTNEGYALSKIIGLKMSEYYSKQYGMGIIALMPSNLYGQNDSFDLNTSHVLSALIRKFYDAKVEKQKSISLWGTGIAKREFMYVDDFSEAAVFFMNYYDNCDFINIGWGKDISIKELATLISNKIGYTGKIVWDDTKPDGMLRKCMDVSKMKELGFTPKITLDDGLDTMIDLYKNYEGN